MELGDGAERIALQALGASMHDAQALEAAIISRWEAEQQQMGHFGANGPPVALGEMGCYGEMPPLHHMDMEREAWEAEQQMAEQQQMGLFGAPSSTLMGYF